MKDLILIERKEDVRIYGRIIGKGGKLGQFEAHSEWHKWDGVVYSLYKDAETKRNALVGKRSGRESDSKKPTKFN